ncbi:HD domain-containing protein 2-like Protein [Tribolium castaneum]|uniref:HD domain-containing protein 2-like Protein n=1 Tax=Tribolium castaneum TaxID=7070 RepID=D6WQL2_TRICA|nr:HD domain-containing protein 2-like Protein [Tribolium castaneum]
MEAREQREATRNVCPISKALKTSEHDRVHEFSVRVASPLFSVEALNPESVLKFMDLVNNLKHSSRRGWSLLNVENHEQIAGHMYAMGMMTFLIGDESNLDRFKCLQLALVHDLAECIVGDITPHDNIPEDKKHALEDKAMKEITSHLGEDIGTMIYKLYKEYEAKETPEAIFVKDLGEL